MPARYTPTALVRRVIGMAGVGGYRKRTDDSRDTVMTDLVIAHGSLSQGLHHHSER